MIWRFLSWLWAPIDRFLDRFRDDYEGHD